jgi:hypothetical protein
MRHRRGEQGCMYVGPMTLMAPNSAPGSAFTLHRRGGGLAAVLLVVAFVGAAWAGWGGSEASAAQAPRARRHLLRAQPTPPGPSGPYLGQRPPGVVPEVFGPGFISTGNRSAGGIAFSPDGNEIYFGSAGLWATRQVSGVWTSPGPAPFWGAESSFEPGMAPDGQRLYFASGMDGDANGPQIWYSDRAGDGWSEPTKLGPGSLTGGKMAPTAAANGNLYFTSVQGQMGWFYMAHWSNGHFETPVRLPSTINAYSRMDHSFVAPDESYLVFSAVSNAGQCLYVSFKGADGSWRTPVKLDANVNATINQIQPSISPDGKYLFFTRWNGEHGDIWWVDASVVFDLRPVSQGPETAPGMTDR